MGLDSEKKKDDEILDAIVRVLESSHDDNSKSLDLLFHEKEGQQALFDCLQQYLVCPLNFHYMYIVRLNSSPKSDLIRK